MDTSEHSLDKKNIDSLFAEHKRSFKQWIKDNQIGIYATVIFHLLVFLALAINQIRIINKDEVVYFELTHEIIEEKDPEIADEEEREKLQDELDRMLRDMPPANVNIPNLTMNAGANGSASGSGHGNSPTFFSTRNTSSLKQEREKQEQEKEQTNPKQGADDVNVNENPAGETGEAYKGPSIVSYFLEGRTAISMPVPAYKCLNGGDVTVIIEVNRLGYVTSVDIEEKNSSKDDCLRTSAKLAAQTARFTASPTSAASQKGNIVYRFVPQ